MQEGFSCHCLTQALLLLSSCSGTALKNSSIGDTIKVVEQLVARHTILPLRSSFLAARRGTEYTSTSNSMRLALLDGIRPAQTDVISNLASDGGLHRDQDLLEIAPLLFSIATRSKARNSLQKRITEDPWLEALFLYLAEIAGISLTSQATTSPTHHSTKLLEELLQIAIDKAVPLDVSILRNIVIRVSGLLSSEPGECRWTLIAKLLKLDATVLLDSSSLWPGHVDESGSPIAPLTSLFSQLTAAGRSGFHAMSDEYKFIKSSILLPLLREFANARNLDGFLTYFHAELIRLERSRSEMDRDARQLSIWEDQDLMHELRSCSESSLTSAQINKSLLALLPDLEAFSASGSEAVPRTYASLVVLGAILGAVQREETVDTLAGTLQSVCGAMTALLCPMSEWPTEHRWLVWQVATSINKKWYRVWLAMPDTDNPANNNLSEALCKWAVDVVCSLGDGKLSGQTVLEHFGRLQMLQAFRFLSSFAALNDIAGDLRPWYPDFAYAGLEAVTSFLDIGHREIERGHSHLTLSWDGRLETLASTEMLTLALAEAILCVPEVLA